MRKLYFTRFTLLIQNKLLQYSVQELLRFSNDQTVKQFNVPLSFSVISP